MTSINKLNMSLVQAAATVSVYCLNQIMKYIQTSFVGKLNCHVVRDLPTKTKQYCNVLCPPPIKYQWNNLNPIVISQNCLIILICFLCRIPSSPCRALQWSHSPPHTYGSHSETCILSYQCFAQCLCVWNFPERCEQN